MRRRYRLFVKREFLPLVSLLLSVVLCIYFSPYIYPSIYLSAFRSLIIFTPTRPSLLLSSLFFFFSPAFQFRSLHPVVVFTRLSLANGCMSIALTQFSWIKNEDPRRNGITQEITKQFVSVRVVFLIDYINPAIIARFSHGTKDFVFILPLAINPLPLYKHIPL